MSMKMIGANVSVQEEEFSLVIGKWPKNYYNTSNPLSQEEKIL